jgi:NADH dehydrogenase
MDKKGLVQKVRIDFSFKREVFFIVIASIVGAFVMIVPKTLFEIQMGLPYYFTWLVYGHIVGIISPDFHALMAGMIVHILAAISIGIFAGIFLYKTNLLNITKPVNGLLYGLLVGVVVFIVFTMPLQELILNPEYAHVIIKDKSLMSSKNSIEDYFVAEDVESNRFTIIIGSLLMDILFGITLGLFSSILSVRYGSRYRCPYCNVSFSRIDVLQNHLTLIHSNVPISTKKILILGGGFAGVEVLKRLQGKFQTDVRIDIRMVSRDNYFLFTPMLPEVASGTIETRHIVTPIREFCNRSRFYAAEVTKIDLEKKEIAIGYTNAYGISPQDELKEQDSKIWEIKETNQEKLNYDYLVLALGSETNFFGLSDILNNAFTIKNLDDAIKLRNHIISLLEQADILQNYKETQRKLLTFVVVGGGFAGVETAGELNDFVRQSIGEFYHNIDINDLRVIMIQSGDKLLPEMNSKRLSEFAIQKLSSRRVEVILNKRATGASQSSIQLNDNTTIDTRTIIWTTGVGMNSLILSLPCEHDERSGRIIVNEYLEVKGHPEVFALGDCAYIMDKDTGIPYPPTAQHAIREADIAAKNIISEVRKDLYENTKKGKEGVFAYKTKGIMATVGKRSGVAIIERLELHGFIAWSIWRAYYLLRLPTSHKKIRVMADWTIDLIFKRDITMLKTFSKDGKR